MKKMWKQEQLSIARTEIPVKDVKELLGTLHPTERIHAYSFYQDALEAVRSCLECTYHFICQMSTSQVTYSPLLSPRQHAYCGHAMLAASVGDFDTAYQNVIFFVQDHIAKQNISKGSMLIGAELMQLYRMILVIQSYGRKENQHGNIEDNLESTDDATEENRAKLL